MTVKIKFLALLLSAMMLLAACGDPAPDSAPAIAGQYDEPDDNDADAEYSGKFYRGEINGDTYSSGFIGISFTLPGENWKFVDDDAIAEMMDTGSEIIADEGVVFDAAGFLLYEMFAKNSVDDSHVMVIVEDLSITSPGVSLSPGDYLELLKNQLEAGELFDYTFKDFSQITIGEQTWDVLSANVDINCTQTKQYYIVRGQSNYMMVIIVSLMGNITFDEVMAHFN